ncbi:DUF4386 domain-containing protein [Actinokineospora sp. PR83]|uniref:DUF4386 domain-containing protein n=1 Tax=Actinokineospora sp. PR83 TaxID=2884908 RepID=UPI001F37716B|nr:DUF4386 domain-containing protein [Actinokineospora sp. PR83]MCG8916317.1 DUF4386 domain-containing protein [Actinokineospora sp. PR83]
MRDRTTGTLMIAGAAAANTAFAVLGAVFDYPDVLGHPAGEVLGRFHRHPVLIGSAFLLLAVGAGLLAPIALRLRRHAGGHGRALAVIGVAAAAVQVVGLLRWPLLVPFLDVESFPVAHTVLGTVLGETIGYLLTAVWTTLAVVALGRRMPGGRFSLTLAATSAPMIAAGVLVPLGLGFADTVNFAGYVLWSLWLVIAGTFFITSGRNAGEEVDASRSSAIAKRDNGSSAVNHTASLPGNR